MFGLVFSRFGSHFHITARIFTFWLAFSHFGSCFHVSAHIFTFWLTFSRFASRLYISPCVFTRLEQIQGPRGQWPSKKVDWPSKKVYWPIEKIYKRAKLAKLARCDQTDLFQPAPIVYSIDQLRAPFIFKDCISACNYIFFTKNPYNFMFIGYIPQKSPILSIWDLFWAVFSHIRGPYRPAKGPLFFQWWYFNIQSYFSYQKSGELDVYWIYSSKITYFEPILAI